MRELTIRIEKALLTGLAPEVGLVGEFMGEMRGMFPNKMAAETIPTIYPLGLWNSNPQLFSLRDGQNILAFEDELYDYDTDEQLLTNDFLSQDDPITIPSGGKWQLSDWGRFWVLSNETCNIFKLQGRPELMVSVDPHVACVANWNDGRAVLGGFDPVTSTRRRALIASYLNNVDVEERALIYGSNGLSDNWVWWSSIGGGDLLAQFNYNAFDPESLRKNESGWAPMPWSGNVITMKELGDKMVIYGSNGISVLVANANQVGVNYLKGAPFSIGIRQCGCVTGTIDQHLFIDTAYNLWMVTPNLECVKLGYSHILNQLNLDNITMIYEPTSQLTWISDGEMGYILSSEGMGGPLNSYPSSLIRIDDKLYGIGINLGVESDGARIKLRTRPVDVDDRGLKHISSIHISSKNLSGLNSTFKGDTQQTRVVQCSPSGVSFNRGSAVEIELGVDGKFNSDSKGHIDWIEAKYVHEDLTFRRGRLMAEVNEQISQ